MIRLAAALIFAACAARAEPPAVVADIAPIHSLVARVMEGAGAPALATPPGASPHGRALRPSEARAIAGADLVVRVAPGLAPWLDEAVAALAPGAAVLSLSELPGTAALPLRGAVDHDHDHGGENTDLHLWLDPANARAWLPGIAEALAAADPKGAALYRANASAAAAEIDALIAEINAALVPARGRPFLVFHDAFQYFEARFALPSAGAVAAGDAAMPGPARIAAARELLARSGAECIFAEPQLPARRLEAIAEGTNARIGRLDPLGASLEPGPALYLALMRGLARDLLACLAP